jgi:hypothetical protein
MRTIIRSSIKRIFHKDVHLLLRVRALLPAILKASRAKRNRR